MYAWTRASHHFIIMTCLISVYFTTSTRSSTNLRFLSHFMVEQFFQLGVKMDLLVVQEVKNEKGLPSHPRGRTF